MINLKGLLSPVTLQIFLFSTHLTFNHAAELEISESGSTDIVNDQSFGSTISLNWTAIPSFYDDTTGIIKPGQKPIETVSYVYCQISDEENSNPEIQFAWTSKNVVPIVCKPGTEQVFTFFKKQWFGKLLSAKGNVYREFTRKSYWPFRLCWIKGIKHEGLVAKIQHKGCQQSSGVFYGLKGNSMKGLGFIQSLRTLNFNNLNIFIRAGKPFDSRVTNRTDVGIATDLDRALSRQFSRLTYQDIWIPDASSLLANKDLVNDLTFQMKKIDKYRGQPQTTLYAHYTASTSLQNLVAPRPDDPIIQPGNYEMYKFENRKYTMDPNYQTGKAIRSSDILSIRLMNKRRELDDELTPFIVCRKKFLPFRKNEEDFAKPEYRFQIRKQNFCTAGWRAVFKAFAFESEDPNDEKLINFPVGAYKFYVFERVQYPHDNIISKIPTPPAGFRMIYDTLYGLPIAKVQGISDKLISAEIRSSSIRIVWKRTPIKMSFRKYAVTISPLPTKWAEQGKDARVMAGVNTFYNFTDLDPGAKYSFTVETLSKKGKPAKGGTFKVSQDTALQLPEIEITSITSSNVGLRWEQDEEIEFYHIDFQKADAIDRIGLDNDEPILPNQVINQLDPDTEYLISITGMVDEKNNIQTDTKSLLVRTSPLAPVINFQAINHKEAEIYWQAIPGYDQYELTIYGDYITGNNGFQVGTKIYQGESENYSFRVKPSRNGLYYLTLRAIADEDISEDGIFRSTNEAGLKRVYSFCQYSDPKFGYTKLNCAPKYIGKEHTDGFDWMFDKNDNFITYEGVVDLNTIEVLHLQNNNINDYELMRKLVESTEALRVLNMQNNTLTTLPPKMFNKQKKLERINLANNQIEVMPNGVFFTAPVTLQRLDFSNNPLSYCGVSKKTFQPIRSQITYLDLTGTGIKEEVRKLLAGEEDLRIGPTGTYSKMCELSV